MLWARWDGLYVSFAGADGICRDPEPWKDRWPTKRAVALPAKSAVTRIDCIGRARKVEAKNKTASVVLDGSPCIVYGLDVSRISTH